MILLLRTLRHAVDAVLAQLHIGVGAKWAGQTITLIQTSVELKSMCYQNQPKPSGKSNQVTLLHIVVCCEQCKCCYMTCSNMFATMGQLLPDQGNLIILTEGHFSPLYCMTTGTVILHCRGVSCYTCRFAQTNM